MSVYVYLAAAFAVVYFCISVLVSGGDTKLGWFCAFLMATNWCITEIQRSIA